MEGEQGMGKRGMGSSASTCFWGVLTSAVLWCLRRGGAGAVSATEEGAHVGRSRCALGHCVGRERPSLSRGVAMRLVGVNGGVMGGTIRHAVR